MNAKLLVFDKDFIKNISDDLLNKLINLKEPIPMRIRSVVLDYHHSFNNQRSLLVGDDEEFRDKIREERAVSRKLPPAEAREYHNDLALDFIKRHPEFAPFIKEVKYLDETSMYGSFLSKNKHAASIIVSAMIIAFLFILYLLLSV